MTPEIHCFSAAIENFNRLLTVMRQFFDVVHQAIQLPLRIGLGLSPEREAVELFVVPQVAEYRPRRGEAPAMACPAFLTVDTLPHLAGAALLVCFVVEERQGARGGVFNSFQDIV